MENLYIYFFNLYRFLHKMSGTQSQILRCELKFENVTCNQGRKKIKRSRSTVYQGVIINGFGFLHNYSKYLENSKK